MNNHIHAHYMEPDLRHYTAAEIAALESATDHTDLFQFEQRLALLLAQLAIPIQKGRAQ